MKPPFRRAHFTALAGQGQCVQDAQSVVHLSSSVPQPLNNGLLQSIYCGVLSCFVCRSFVGGVVIAEGVL
jgi:hypothetical protein